jgi:hypothetical protein
MWYTYTFSSSNSPVATEVGGQAITGSEDEFKWSAVLVLAAVGTGVVSSPAAVLREVALF